MSIQREGPRIGSSAIAAVSLTKSLSRVRFQKHRRHMVIPQSLLSEFRGRVRNNFQSSQTNQEKCKVSGSLESNHTNYGQCVCGHHTTLNIFENDFENNSEEEAIKQGKWKITPIAHDILKEGVTSELVVSGPNTSMK